MAKLKSYFIQLIILLSACLFCQIFLIVILSIDNSNLKKQAEIQYLTVYLKDDATDWSNVEEIDSILIDGGVIKTDASKVALVDTGMLDSIENRETTHIDYLNSLLNYIGAFGWELVSINDDVLHFSRFL